LLQVTLLSLQLAGYLQLVAISREPTDRTPQLHCRGSQLGFVLTPQFSPHSGLSPHSAVPLVNTSAMQLPAIRNQCESRGVGVKDCLRPLLLNDPNLDFGMDVSVQSDGHSVHSERADRLVQLDLPLLEVESLRLELMRDVR
jgi:hypothetical protein